MQLGLFLIINNTYGLVVDIYMQADREARGRRNGSYMIFDDDYIY